MGMKIGLICEGCYPYVVGGVSSWIQQLAQNMPQHTFHILAIAPSESMRGHYSYPVPDNVEEITEIFLDEIFKEAKGFVQVRIPAEVKELLRGLLLKQRVDYGALFDYFRHTSFRIPDILMGEDFYEIAIEIYNAHYQNAKFAEFLWTLRSMYMTLFFVLKQGLPEVDLYHTVATGYSGVLAAMGKHFTGKPMIISEHGIYTREREEEIIKATWIKSAFKDLWIDYFYIMSEIAYAFSDRTVSLFERARAIQISLGCIPEHTLVISNGINPDVFAGAPEKPGDDSHINIGAVLRVTPIKDVKTMIYAFSVVKKKIPYARLYILGPCDEDEDYFLECNSLVELLRIEDVVFTGRIVVKEYIKKLDIILLTSISEGQPLSILEGFAASRPCVCTNVGCCNELVHGNNDGFGDAGFIVPIMDYEKIADALITLCEDEKLRRAMGEAGRNRLIQSYSEEKFLRDYRDLYDLFNPNKRQ